MNLFPFINLFDYCLKKIGIFELECLGSFRNDPYLFPSKNSQRPNNKVSFSPRNKKPIKSLLEITCQNFALKKAFNNRS